MPNNTTPPVSDYPTVNLPTEGVTQEAIEQVVTSLTDRFDDDLFSTPAAGLEKYWHFKWDDSAPLEINIYEFHDYLDLYSSMCRRWEEHYHGRVCVVERVRDKYMLPKIREFILKLDEHRNKQPSLKSPTSP